MAKKTWVAARPALREDGHDLLLPELLEGPGKNSRAIEHIPEV
ncbi:hypothetical protein [Methanoculleus sp.]|nr:hypothetical protein [Methanoculleus sp.]